MGEELNLGKPQVYLVNGGKAIELNTEGIDKPVQIKTASLVEIESEENKYGIEEQINRSYNFTLQILANSEFAKFMKRLERQDRMTRKGLFWAVTHGCRVCFFAESNSNTYYFVADTPKKLRVLLMCFRCVPKYLILNNRFEVMRIKRGRCVPAKKE